VCYKVKLETVRVFGFPLAQQVRTVTDKQVQIPMNLINTRKHSRKKVQMKSAGG